MLKKISALATGLLATLAVLAAPTVEMTTNMGAFTLELFPDKAPKTVEMFLYNAKHGYYEATIFHRVIDGFMIQGGGFTMSMDKKKELTPALQNTHARPSFSPRSVLCQFKGQRFPEPQDHC